MILYKSSVYNESLWCSTYYNSDIWVFSEGVFAIAAAVLSYIKLWYICPPHVENAMCRITRPQCVISIGLHHAGKLSEPLLVAIRIVFASCLNDKHLMSHIVKIKRRSIQHFVRDAQVTADWFNILSETHKLQKNQRGTGVCRPRVA